MTTSFLSIALCLTDFLSDGLRLPKKGLNHLVILGGTFLPPLGIVLFYPGGFMRALEYAGVCIVVLMVLMPPLMVWRGRRHYQATHAKHLALSRKVFLASLMLFAIMMIGFGLRSV
jgi:tyrosine-specific transport protein